jgi:hypothetical protein
MFNDAMPSCGLVADGESKNVTKCIQGYMNFITFVANKYNGSSNGNQR